MERYNYFMSEGEVIKITRIERSGKTQGWGLPNQPKQGEKGNKEKPEPVGEQPIQSETGKLIDIKI